MKIPTGEISIEQTSQGALLLTWISDDNRYFKQQYMGYSKRECINMFREYCITQ